LASAFPGAWDLREKESRGGGTQKGFRYGLGYDASTAEVETGDQVEAANAGVILASRTMLFMGPDVM